MKRINDIEIEKQGSFYNYTIMDTDVSEKTKCPYCKEVIEIAFPEIAVRVVCYWCNTRVLVLSEDEKEFMIKEEEND